MGETRVVAGHKYELIEFSFPSRNLRREPPPAAIRGGNLSDAAARANRRPLAEALNYYSALYVHPRILISRLLT